MGDFLFLFPSASGSGLATTTLPFPFSQDSEVALLEDPATLLATMGGEGRSTRIEPTEGPGATGRSNVWSPNASQATILLHQACFNKRGLSYPMLCQLGQTWGVMPLTRSNSFTHDSRRPGMWGPFPYSRMVLDYPDVGQNQRKEKRQCYMLQPHFGLFISIILCLPFLYYEYFSRLSWSVRTYWPI